MLGEQTYTTCNLLQDHLPYDILNRNLGELRSVHQRDHMYHPNLHITFSHFLIWMPGGEDMPFILNGMVWVGMSHDFGRRVLGGSIFFLPLEGNHVAAQDQHTFDTYHKWRRGQHGIGLLSYHFHLFIPPTFQEHKVEETFQELPCWRVTHFIWIIACTREVIIHHVDHHS